MLIITRITMAIATPAPGLHPESPDLSFTALAPVGVPGPGSRGLTDIVDTRGKPHRGCG